MRYLPNKQMLTEFVRLIRSVPATITVTFVILAAGFATKAFWIPADAGDIAQRFGYGLPAFREGQYLNIITGMLILPAPWMYFMLLPMFTLAAGYIERNFGVLRMLVTVFVTHIGAVLLVAGMLALLDPYNIPWVKEIIGVHDIGFSNSAFGAIGAVSAAMPVLWRRRVRAVAVIYCLTFVLFSAVIWDFTHFAGLLIGLAIGPWVVGRPYNLTKPKFTPESVRAYMAGYLCLQIIAQLVIRYYPGNGGVLQLSPNDEQNTTLYTVANTLVMLLLVYGIYHGRKIAWRVALVLSGLATGLLWLGFVIVIVTGTSGVYNSYLLMELVLTTLFFVGLIVYRKAFTVKGDKSTRWRTYRRLVTVGVLLLVGNALVIFAFRAGFRPHPTFLQALRESASQIFGISSHAFVATNDFTKLYLQSISLIWFVFVLTSIAILVFTTYRAHNDRDAFADYDQLLHDKGCTSIGWMARWPGLAYWVNPSKTAGYAYRLEGNTAIVLSDPVGTPQAVRESLTAFERSCNIVGWKPVFYAVTERTKRMLVKSGYTALSVGEDTVVPLQDLEFAGKPWQSIRSAINRAKKENVTMHAVQYSNASIGMKDQLQSIARGWVEDKSLPEMGFTLGTLKEAADPEVRMHIAVDESGTVHGMTSWMPIYRKGRIIGWTIDIMQRRLHDQTMQGVIEFLIAESAMTFKQEGYEIMSLSAAPLARSGEASGVIERLLDMVADRMEPYYGFKSLYRFKQKFQPRHEPMYLCYRDSAQLPAIALAIGKAYMPDMSIRDIAGLLR